MTVTVTGRRRGRKADQTDAGFPSAPPPPEHVAKQRTARHDAVTDFTSLIVQIPLAGLATVEQHRIGPDEIGAFTLDVVTVESHKEPLATAICDLADTYPVLGGVLDKLAKATPFGALFGVVVSLGCQLAENHRALPPHMRGMSPNLVSRDDLAERLRAETMAQQAEQAAQADKVGNGARQSR